MRRVVLGREYARRMLLFEALELPPEQAYRRLIAFSGTDAHPDQVWYARWWASDALVLMGEYRRAIEVYPPANTQRATYQTERLLSLKAETKMPYSVQDLIALLGPRVTTFGKQNIELVREAAAALVAAEDDRARVDRLTDWAASAPRSPFQVYAGSSAGYDASKRVEIAHLGFTRVLACVNYCTELVREAENMVREDRGVPHVGQGWISETRLYREIEAALTPLKVVQHASPEWLGRQHLEVYIPELSVAVEYQGAQHDQPVEYFGGEAAFLATVKRDRRKRRLCKANGVSLIYAREGYDLSEVLRAVRNSSGA